MFTLLGVVMVVVVIRLTVIGQAPSSIAICLGSTTCGSSSSAMSDILGSLFACIAAETARVRARPEQEQSGTKCVPHSQQTKRNEGRRMVT